MSHFAFEDWADFVRGLESADRKAAMQSHLDEGCKKCAGIARMWGGTLEIAARESSYQPPEREVRTVKSSYIPERTQKALGGGAQIARLVFDSFRQPRPEGIRTVGPRARHLLYQAGRFSVDLRLDTGPERAFLVGQVMDSTRPDQRVADIPVTLFRSRTSVSKAVTNRLGEFCFRFEDPGSLRIWIGINEERPILIKLTRDRTFEVPGFL